MQTESPQIPNNFITLSRENLLVLADAQRRLLIARERNRLPRDGRSIANLERLKAALETRR